MDVFGVNQLGNIGKKQQKKSKKAAAAAANIKVVYISSPMKVQTSASEFRDLVQKLTGQHSDAERSMELINGAAAANPRDHHPTSVLDYSVLGDHHDHRLVSNKLPTSSYRSPVGLPDDALLHNFDASFTGPFQRFFHESALL